MSYPVVHLRDIAPRSRYMTSWERVKYSRFHLLTEMFAEMLGVFIYVYAGVGTTAGFVLGNLLSQPIGSLFTVGAGYSVGIMLAIMICAATSGGHLNPCITISFIAFRGFPVKKGAMYILAHLLGAYLACLCVYVQWKDLIVAAEAVLVKKGVYHTMMFGPHGPGGIFALHVSPGTNLLRVLLNEFITDFLIGLTISACLDPTNHMIPPSSAPWVIGFAYGVAIWGFAPVSLAANTARDVGARAMAMTIWGTKAAGGPYSAIAALTNIPATLLAFFVYDTLLISSSRILSPEHIAFLRAHKIHHEENGLVPPGHLSVLGPRKHTTSSTSFDEKTSEVMMEFGHARV